MGISTWVLRIIIANLVMFILSQGAPEVDQMLMLVPFQILDRPWTLVTYMFLHANTSHILFNMLGLFFFGPRIEMMLGGKKFLLLYCISGITGGLLSFVFSPGTAIVGASAAVYGIMFGFAFYWPRESIYIWGVFPVQSRYLVLVMTALSLLGGFGGGGDGVAHFAHLGGFLGGFLYLKWIDRARVDAQKQELAKSLRATGADLQRWAAINRDALHVVNREEYDRIMEKVKTSGPESLSVTERTFLDRFSAA